MTNFSVKGPFEIPFYTGVRGRLIRRAEGIEFFARNASIRAQIGCYVFGMKAGRGITPVYAGKATKSFHKECFTSTKLNKYNQCLIDYARGTPIMFFVMLPIRRGPKNVKHISELERFLIQTGMAANPDLLNVQGTRSAEWGITGVLRSGQGKPSKSALGFRNMMKL